MSYCRLGLSLARASVMNIGCEHGKNTEHVSRDPFAMGTVVPLLEAHEAL